MLWEIGRRESKSRGREAKVQAGAALAPDAAHAADARDAAAVHAAAVAAAVAAVVDVAVDVDAGEPPSQ